MVVDCLDPFMDLTDFVNLLVDTVAKEPALLRALRPELLALAKGHGQMLLNVEHAERFLENLEIRDQAIQHAMEERPGAALH